MGTRESSDMSTRRHSARSRVVLAQLWASASAATDPVQAHVLQLQNCEDKLRMILGTQVSTEKLIRLGVIDALIGSADGSILLAEGIDQNIDSAIQTLRPLKKHFPRVSWSDLIQMARALSIESINGPRIKMLYGRVDTAVLKRAENDSTRINRREREAVHAKLRDTISQLSSTAGAIRLLADAGLTYEHVLILAGEIDSNFAGTPNLLEVSPQFTTQHALYSADRTALMRDYLWAHKELSELGATFSPPAGLATR